MTGHAEEHAGTHAGQGRPGQPARSLRLLVRTLLERKLRVWLENRL